MHESHPNPARRPGDVDRDPDGGLPSHRRRRPDDAGRAARDRRAARLRADRFRRARAAGRAGSLGAAAIASLAALAGCSLVDAAERRTETTYPTRATAALGWQADAAIPPWIPADASGIHVRWTLDRAEQIVAVTSDLEPSACEERTREALPALSAEWAPTLESFPRRVLRCGEFEVMPTDDGWFGWRTGSLVDRD